jgi:hypothetical protein
MGLYSKSMIYKIIDKLINSGVIVRVSRGKYKWNNRKAISISKKQLVESRQMTPEQLLEFAKETKPRIVNDKGTLVIEYEDEYTIREVRVSNITVYDNMVIVRIMGRPLVWKITRNELRRLITMH